VWWEQPDGTTGLNGQHPADMLYRLETLREVPPGDPVILTEGETAADALARLGYAALGTVTGAGKDTAPLRISPAAAAHLTGRPVCLFPDNDDAGRAHMAANAEVFAAAGARIGLLDWAEAPDKGDAVDLVARLGVDGARTRIAELVAAVFREGPPTSRQGEAVTLTLAEAIAVFRRWLWLPDTDALLAALGAVVANRRDGDPVWVLVVAPPGTGKTEAIQPLAGLDDVWPTATLTEAALLSGTPRREAKGAKGGLLKEIGDFGIILCKDFGSVLSMNRDSRALVLAALREIYDGSWTRRVGTDGGRELSWSGKVGLVAGCTPVIDSHYAVLGAMGDRMAFYRLPKVEAREQISPGPRHR
jgi:hypothetical protein